MLPFEHKEQSEFFPGEGSKHAIVKNGNDNIYLKKIF